ncbi:type 2 DNA topoisomerase 6 subunit B-like, partial [Trichechus manatus latirostris]|uniref:Type 2 DNA topoisomerase 6 subunit B-like n=1 Tax=Trichechus manatus latirostris TaxID=127582 RepID=A0A2Y9RJY0_TRIMA
MSAKLMWTLEETSCFPDTSGVSPFQMIFEVDEKHRTLMTDCLAIKNFLRKIIMVHPKMRFHFSIKVNGTLSKEIFGVEDEPILNLPNGIALVVNYQHYISRPKFGATELLCSRIHPVPGQPVTLSIPDDVAAMGLLGELILMPAAALCPCPKAFSNQMNRISSVSIFLYGPSGLPLLLPSREQPTTLFTDISCFIDWKKYHLCVVPNVDFSLDRELVVPDVSYQVESREGDQSQNTDPQGHTLLLFLFVDFHSGFPVQRMELWGIHTLLTTHLNAILLESQRVVQDSIQIAVDQALEQHHQAAKAHQKLQAFHAVAVNSIMSVVTGSTNSSFRKMCLQAFQATDTREFGTKLHKAFNEITQHRFLHHCSCGVKQLPAERHDAAQSAEDACESRSPELLPETSAQAESKRCKKSADETRAFRSTR